MNYNPEKHHRHSIRLKAYDYTQAGAYYFTFTICCHQRRCLLGEIKDGVMHLNLIGATVQSVWENLPRHFPLIELDAFVVMPNHIHGIIVITDNSGNCNPSRNNDPTSNLNPDCRGEAFVLGCNNTSPESLSTNASPFPACNNTPPESLSKNASPFLGSNDTLPPRGTQSSSIGAILQNFKSVATRRVNRITQNAETLWQRNYHEEIIRNERALKNIRRYIVENPVNWDEDEENPLKFKPKF